MKKYLKRLSLLMMSTLLMAGPCVSALSTPAHSAAAEPLKKRATFYTEEKLANMRENVEKYVWARTTVNNAVEKADFYLDNYSLKELWELIPSQHVYRSYGVNQTYGCLNCGLAIDKFGNYPYTHNHNTEPWKITCPACGMKFPTNDFGAYYRSGLDENGEFQQKLADRSLLV
nr:hypothetical protein [Clostridia bacterium]